MELSFQPTGNEIVQRRIRPEVKRRVFELSERDLQLIIDTDNNFNQYIKPVIDEKTPDKQYHEVYLGDLYSDDVVDIDKIISEWPFFELASDSEDAVALFENYEALVRKAIRYRFDNVVDILAHVRDPILAQLTLFNHFDQLADKLASEHSEVVAISILNRYLGQVRSLSDSVRRKYLERFRLFYTEMSTKHEERAWSDQFNGLLRDDNVVEAFDLLLARRPQMAKDKYQGLLRNISNKIVPMIDEKVKENPRLAIDFYLSLPRKLVLDTRTIGKSLQEDVTDWLNLNHYGREKFNNFVRDNFLQTAPEVYAMFAVNFDTRENFSSEDRFYAFNCVSNIPGLEDFSAAIFNPDDFHEARQDEMKPKLLALYLNYKPEKLLYFANKYKKEIAAMDPDQQLVLAEVIYDKKMFNVLDKVEMSPEVKEYLYRRLQMDGLFAMFTTPEQLRNLGLNRSQVMADLYQDQTVDNHMNDDFWWMWFQFYRDKPNKSIVGYLQRFAEDQVPEFNQYFLDHIIELDNVEQLFTSKQRELYEKLSTLFPENIGGVKPKPVVAYLHAMRSQIGFSLEESMATMIEFVRDVGPYVMPHVLALYRSISEQDYPLTSAQKKIGIKTIEDLKNYVDPVFEADSSLEVNLDRVGDEKLVQKFISQGEGRTPTVEVSRKKGSREILRRFDTFSRAQKVRYQDGGIDAIEKKSDDESAIQFASWETAGTQYLRERAVSVIAEYLDHRLFVPPTQVKKIEQGYGSSQVFIHNTIQYNTYKREVEGAQVNSDEFLKLLLTDLMLWNIDRNLSTANSGGNVLINDKHQAVLIDNGLTFMAGRLRLVHSPDSYHGRVIPKGFMKALQQISADGDQRDGLKERLLGYLSEEDVRTFLARVDYVVANLRQNNGIMNPDLFAGLRYDPDDSHSYCPFEADEEGGAKHITLTQNGQITYMGIDTSKLSLPRMIEKYKQLDGVSDVIVKRRKTVIDDNDI
ncbi:hypothetical protein COT97_03670 [Candidatus Falkowbacteria bacterium CG10_big_fil_rev_8_21_14_0_10_39_11]|uniref:PI3K/PI4K catalytic domain-containing protein n=1 Tax=Candidatus Falkowbacteria bacterium CG10_big_fil_rev_8_21_14_0_10_39_11 TaxID=1974565 RepID=A0A2H0V4H1_9BACT|nr:MAG: hypothetical protein COT97_03670 [Candidatus Falkowbacteria bacterium CG10_big_fil_rev_8_21_14_0_10_39_11]